MTPLERIRALTYEGQQLLPGIDYRYCEDQKYATIDVSQIEALGDLPYPSDPDSIPMAVWLTWYKSRRRTDSVWMLFVTGPPRSPTDDELSVIADHYKAMQRAFNRDSSGGLGIKTYDDDMRRREAEAFWQSVYEAGEREYEAEEAEQRRRDAEELWRAEFAYGEPLPEDQERPF
jgi:hypothetical protein